MGQEPRIFSEVSSQPSRVRCHPLMETERMNLKEMLWYGFCVKF